MIFRTNKKLIAIIGMAGAGKTEVINFLQEKHGWPKVYFGDVVFDELKRKNLEINWKNERNIREKLREDHGMGAMATLSLKRIKKNLKENNIVLIESLYSWDEYKIIKKKFKEKFETIAIFTPKNIRFERLKTTKIRPIKTKKELENRDYTEIEGTDKGGPIAIADYTIINNKTLTKLKKEVNKVIDNILK